MFRVYRFKKKRTTENSIVRFVNLKFYQKQDFKTPFGVESLYKRQNQYLCQNNPQEHGQRINGRI